MPETALLAEADLAQFIARQRWFGSKARDVNHYGVLAEVPLRMDGEPQLVSLLVEVRYAAGTHDVYQLPVGLRHVNDGWTEGVIAQVGDRVAYDALRDPA